MEALEIEVYKSTGIVFSIVLGKINLLIIFGQFRKSAYLCNRKRGEIRLPRKAHFLCSAVGETWTLSHILVGIGK